jgi:hypothetical protein
MSDTVWDPVRGVEQLDWRYKKSGQSLKVLLPYFYNQMRDYGDASVAGRIISGVIQCVALGEEKFQQAFGGWMPESNEFGLCPLRPAHVDKVNGRWRWTSGTTSSINWSAEDGFISSFSLASDELILVYGYFNLEPVPNTLELFIQPGSEKLPIWSIEQMRVMEESYFILPKPIIIEPRSQFAVLASVKSGTTATAEEAGLMGYMFAPKSKLITKKRVVS